ncbi:IclR family transcriptional regulator [Paraburkholderia oxyphila]|uniref:IclR family transcriptional regulator n=1 Tax=Paraburkholderia oxyphila TaxID=614212 RepID=UPI0004873725|nr:IclR family transcriptional regulator [Paraburkholderia oxyphila]
MLKSLGSALQLMRYFTAQQPAWGVRELAKASGVHHAVVHRVLATFAAEGYLVQDELGRYALGLRWFEMGEIVRHTVSPTEVVGPVLHRLVEESGETVFLSVLDGDEGLCLNIAHSEQQLRFSIEEGQRFPLHEGSHGKAILAFLPDAARAGLCAQAQSHGEPVERAALDAHLERIRTDGWAYTSEESAPGVAGIAVPVWMKDRKRVAGSLAISGPMQRLDEASVPRLLDVLREAQRKIEGVVGLLR